MAKKHDIARLLEWLKGTAVSVEVYLDEDGFFIDAGLGWNIELNKKMEVKKKCRAKFEETLKDSRRG